MTLSASQIASRALGLTPKGRKKTEWIPSDLLNQHNFQYCALCAKPLTADDPIEALRLPMTFTDFAALVAGQKLCCGWCEATRDQSVMRELQRSVITSHGVYSIATDDARAWFLLTPPPPPFVAVLQTRSPTATFHLHWKTPVTLDQDLLQVRVDDRLLVIRRQVLMKALNDCQTVADEMQARRQVAKRREALHHPYLSLDRNLTGTSHGVLHPEAVALADAKDCSVGVIAALNRLSTLLPGELWALATLAKANPPIPTRPPLITRVGQRKETAANVL